MPVSLQAHCLRQRVAIEPGADDAASPAARPSPRVTTRASASFGRIRATRPQNAMNYQRLLVLVDIGVDTQGDVRCHRSRYPTAPLLTPASASATRIAVEMATSGLSEIESMPSRTSHSANSG